MRLLRKVLPLTTGIVGLMISARALSTELTLWALLLLVVALVLLLFSLARPMFAQRVRGGRARSGLPSKYERVQDPWRALSAGQDPTEQS